MEWLTWTVAGAFVAGWVARSVVSFLGQKTDDDGMPV